MSSNQQALLMADDDAGVAPPAPATCVADPYYSCGPTNDPYWANVVLYVPFSGADGATTATDVSLSAHAITLNSAAVVDTAPLFGENAVEFTDSTSSYASLANDIDFTFDGDFTVEAWIYPRSYGFSYIFAEDYASAFAGSWGFRITNTGALDYIKIGGSGLFTSGLIVVNLNAWNHVAFVRQGSTMAFLVNGIRNGTRTDSSVVGVSGSGTSAIGSNTGFSFDGFISQVRITKGIARYTGSFNIPTEAFPDALEVNKDPYLDSVVLHLRGDGVDGGTTFTDISSQGLVPTVVGGITTATDAQAFAGTSIKSVTGGSSYLKYDFLFADTSEDFTFEFFYRILSQEGIGNGYVDGRGTIVRLLNDSAKVFEASGMISNVNTQVLATPGAIAVTSTTYGAVDGYDRFYCVFARKGGYSFALLNGRLATGISTLVTDKINEIRIGNAALDLSRETSAAIEEVRFTKGVCRYMPQSAATAVQSFRIPLEPHPAEEGISWIPDTPRTVLSLHADDVNVEDSSCYQPKTVTLEGTLGNLAEVTDVESRFGGKSFYIPNPGSSTTAGVVINDHMDLDFGTGDFTIEMWAYRAAHTYAGTLFYFTESAAFSLVVAATTGLVTLNYRSSGGTQANVATGVTFPLTTWQHVVVQRRGTNFEFYLHGVLGNSTAITGGATSTVNSAGDFYLGRINASSALSWNGYIDEARVTKGVARYANPNLPTAAFPDSAPEDPYWANVVLLLHFDGADGSTAFTDTSLAARTIAAFSSAQVDTSNPQFGTGAGYFPTGTNSYLTTGDGYDMPGDFTVEFWVRFESVTRVGQILFALTSPSALNHFYVVATTNGTAASIGVAVGAQTINNLTYDLVVDTWYHIAVVRSGSTVTLYKQGLPAGTMTTTFSPADTRVGQIGYEAGTGNSLYGYLDDFRITKGIARYPASFDLATLPNCDSTTAGTGRTVDGTSPLTGASVTVQQQPLESQDADVYLTNNFIDIGPPLAFRVNRIDTYAGTITASSVNLDRTLALTGTSATVSRGSLTVPAYPNLVSSITDVIEVLGVGNTATLTVTFFTNGTYTAVDQTAALRASGTWIDTTQTNYTIADISSQYRVAAVSVFSGATYTYTAPPVVLSGSFSVTVQNLSSSLLNVVDFQVTVVPTTNNPRYGEAFYTCTHRIKAVLSRSLA